jgi:AraC-like DNA-binding protein
MKSPKNKKETFEYGSKPSLDINMILNEPETAYGTVKHVPSALYVITEDFTYTHFKKILTRAPFTLAQWATMLHISERTLHRYANDNATFNGLLVERILLLERFIDVANEHLGKGFKAWLDAKPFSIYPHKVFDILSTHEGIEEAIRIVMRIQYGISA